MTDAPEFVRIVRGIIPQDGVKTEHPNRVKSKVKKSLVRAGYAPETIRGVGLKVGDYAIVYDIVGDVIGAKFQEHSTLVIKKSKKSRSGKGKNKAPLMTGVNPLCLNLSAEEFFEQVAEMLPNEWKEQPGNAYRWATVDTDFLRNTQHTVSSASLHIVHLADTLLSKLEVVNYTKLTINDHHLIGIGPI